MSRLAGAAPSPTTPSGEAPVPRINSANNITSTSTSTSTGTSTSTSTITSTSTSTSTTTNTNNNHNNDNGNSCDNNDNRCPACYDNSMSCTPCSETLVRHSGRRAFAEDGLRGGRGQLRGRGSY